MTTAFHFLRPYWLLCFIPIALFCVYFIKRTQLDHAWRHICDPHLLPHLIKTQQTTRYNSSWMPVLSLFFCILSLAGPAFVKLPVPIYQHQQAHVLILDLSNTMLAEDISPSRLQRAKFKLRDLFRNHHTGQVALIVYTGEPFVVAPLTDDGKTIDALTESLTPDIMPVGGNRLDSALLEAEQLIQRAGFKNGSILVLTSETPSPMAIESAAALAKHHIATSILPVLHKKQVNALFTEFATAGHGEVVHFTETSDDIQHWLSASQNHPAFKTTQDDTVPQWRDDGRWFLIPAILFILPLFRRGGILRLQS
jgi:Ca-activated chloride channel family protein